jgi:hypothetical protein
MTLVARSTFTEGLGERQRDRKIERARISGNLIMMKERKERS